MSNERSPEINKDPLADRRQAGFLFVLKGVIKMDYPVIDVAATGRNIDLIIRGHGYTVGQIADYLGTTDSLVYRYIRGDVLPSIDRLLALSMLLHIPINDILVVI